MDLNGNIKKSGAVFSNTASFNTANIPYGNCCQCILYIVDAEGIWKKSDMYNFH
jgi:hypothetical protein